MPSLARKSMKMMRDAYNFAATYDVNKPSPPLPGSTPYYSGTGLSSQFAQPPQPYPPSPYTRPSTAHGQAPPPPFGQATYLSPTSNHAQPHAPWTNGTTPPVPPLPYSHQVNPNPPPQANMPIDPYTGQPYPPPSPNVPASAPYPGQPYQQPLPGNSSQFDSFPGQPHPPPSPIPSSTSTYPAQGYAPPPPPPPGSFQNTEYNAGYPMPSPSPVMSPVSPSSAGTQPPGGHFFPLGPPHIPVRPPVGQMAPSTPSPALGAHHPQGAGLNFPPAAETQGHVVHGSMSPLPNGHYPHPHFPPRPVGVPSPQPTPPPPLPSRTPSRATTPAGLGLAPQPHQLPSPPPAVTVSGPEASTKYYEMAADPIPSPAPVPPNVFEMDSSEPAQLRPANTLRPRAHTTTSATPSQSSQADDHFELPGTVTSFQALSPHQTAGSAAGSAAGSTTGSAASELKPSSSPASWRQSCTLEVVQQQPSNVSTTAASPREQFQVTSTKLPERTQSQNVGRVGALSPPSEFHNSNTQTTFQRPHSKSVSSFPAIDTAIQPANVAPGPTRQDSTSTVSTSTSYAAASQIGSPASSVSQAAPYDMKQMLGAVNSIQTHRPSHSWSNSPVQTVASPESRQETWSSTVSTVVSPPPSQPAQLSRFDQYNYQPNPGMQPMHPAYHMAPPQNVSVQHFQGHYAQMPPNTGQTMPYLNAAPNQAHPAQNMQSDRKSEPMPNAMRVQQDGTKARTRKILSLDGGGVRGLSTLLILDYLMTMLGNIRGARLEPWQEFDMIAGTSTGGLIAIMLGRLRMSVKQAIEAYKHLSKEIFTAAHHSTGIIGQKADFLKGKGKFRSEPLERCVKDMLRAQGLYDDDVLVDQNADSPAVFVCAVEGVNSDAVVIRSYQTQEYDDLYGVCKIWEAARATSAASTFFDPIKIGDRLYVDGALKHNNPIEKIDEESKDLWPGQERLIISIGTGAAPGREVTGDLKNLVEALKKIVTDTEDASNAYRRRNRDMIESNRLFRFNVMHGLADVGLEEHEAVPKVAAHTSTYLRKFDTARDIECCANALKETGQRLGFIAGEELATYQHIQRVASTTCEFCEDCHNGIPYSDPIFLCTECGIVLCPSCQTSHDNSHMRKIIRFRTMQWMEKMPALQSSVTCVHCTKDSKVRWQCEKCDHALCRRCAGNFQRRTQFLTDHEGKHPDHRTYVAVYPPFWTTTAKWVTDNCQCSSVTPVGLSHCDKCHDIISLGTRTHICNTCLGEFGSAQGLCASCYSKEDPTHLQTHKWGTIDWIFSPNAPDELDKDMKLFYHCPLCPQEQIPEGREHTHPHPNLQFLLGPMFLELCLLVTSQTCQRRRIKADLAKSVDPVKELKCGACLNPICFNTVVSICLTRKCTQPFCAPCTEANRIRHRHPLYKATINRPPSGNTMMITCRICSNVNMASMFQGLWCGDCNMFNVCLQCVGQVNNGQRTLPEGLAHHKILKPCKTRSWYWYQVA